MFFPIGLVLLGHQRLAIGRPMVAKGHQVFQATFEICHHWHMIRNIAITASPFSIEDVFFTIFLQIIKSQTAWLEKCPTAPKYRRHADH